MHAERRGRAGAREREHEDDRRDRNQDRSEDLHDPHPATHDAHARDIRGCREILGAHSMRLRAVGRCGKPPDAYLDPGPDPPRANPFSRDRSRHLQRVLRGCPDRGCGGLAGVSSAGRPSSLGEDAGQRLAPSGEGGHAVGGQDAFDRQIEQGREHRPQVAVRSGAEPPLGAEP